MFLDRVDQLLPRRKPAFTLLFVLLACVWTFPSFFPILLASTLSYSTGQGLDVWASSFWPFLRVVSFVPYISLSLSCRPLSSFLCVFLFLFLATAGRERPCSQMKRWQGTVSSFVSHSRELCQWGAWHRNNLCRGISRLLIEKEKNNCSTISWALLHGNVEFHRYVNIRQCSHLPKLFYE